MFIRIFLISSLLVLLSACASSSRQVVLAPQISHAPQTIYSGQNIYINVKDLRTNNHLVQVLRKDKAAELYSPAQALNDVLQQQLTGYLTRQGLNAQSGNTTMTVAIEKALVSVQQSLMKYQAHSEIRLSVNITKGDKTLTNVITSKGNSNGPLTADLAVLERDLNQQLGKVISDLANNAELIAFIKDNH